MTGRRLVRALDLVDDERLIAAYRHRHASGAVWPEVIAYLRATGVFDMEIWWINTRLVMIMEVAEDFPREVAEPERVSAWESCMWEFRQPLPGTPPGIKWMDLTRIFALEGY